MQQNTQAIQASASQAAANAESNVIVQALNDPEIILILSKREVTDEEAVKLFLYLSLLLRAHEQYWEQYKLGVLDEATLNRYGTSLAAQLSFPSSRSWWESMKQRFDPEFSTRVDRMLEHATISEGSVSEGLRRSIGVNGN